MPRMSVPLFRERKDSGDKLTVLTAYDYPSAQAIDACDVDARQSVHDTLILKRRKNPDPR